MRGIQYHYDGLIVDFEVILRPFRGIHEEDQTTGQLVENSGSRGRQNNNNKPIIFINSNIAQEMLSVYGRAVQRRRIKCTVQCSGAANSESILFLTHERSGGIGPGMIR